MTKTDYCEVIFKLKLSIAFLQEDLQLRLCEYPWRLQTKLNVKDKEKPMLENYRAHIMLV